MMEKILPFSKRSGWKAWRYAHRRHVTGVCFRRTAGRGYHRRARRKKRMAYTGIYQKLNNEFLPLQRINGISMSTGRGHGSGRPEKVQNVLQASEALDKQIVLLKGDEKAMKSCGDPY